MKNKHFRNLSIDEILSTEGNIKNHVDISDIFENQIFKTTKIQSLPYINDKVSLELILNKLIFSNQAKYSKLKGLQDMINVISKNSTDKIRENIKNTQENKEKIISLIYEYEKKTEEEINTHNQLNNMKNQENIMIVINILEKKKKS